MSLALFISDVSKHLSTSRYMSTSARAFHLLRYSMTMVCISSVEIHYDYGLYTLV